MPQYDLLKASAVTAIQSDLEDAVENDRIAAQDARIASETARDQSQASAIASGASIYATTGDGLADTPDGDLFYVPESNGLRVYENVAGSAVAGIFLSQPAFTTRAAAVSTVGDGNLADGTLISAGGVLYEAQEGATVLSDWTGVVPYGDPLPAHFNAAGDGLTDDTAAINAFLSYYNNANLKPNWGDSAQVHVVSGNLTSLMSYQHRGKAKIESGSDVFYIGEDWIAKQNIIYVSASGSATNDGLTPGTALTFKKGHNSLERQAKNNPKAKWRLQLLAGTYTYTAGDEARLEDWPATTYPIEIFGQTDGSNIPTVVFSEWPQNSLRRLEGAPGLNFFLKDMKWQNCTAGCVFIRYGFAGKIENLHADQTTGAASFSFRGGRKLETLNCVITHTGTDAVEGLVVQDCYCNIEGWDISGVKGPNGNARAINVSRGSMTYVQDCALDDNDIHISSSRNARVRCRGNTIGDFTTAAYDFEMGSIMNDDLADLDDLSGAILASGDTPIRIAPSAMVSRYAGPSEDIPHLQSNETISVTGTSRTVLNTGLYSLFRMPGIWMYSPNARGIRELEMRAATTENVTIEFSGAASGAGQVVNSIVLPTQSGRRYKLRFEMTGPLDGTNVGRSSIFVFRADETFSNFAAVDLNYTAFRSNSMDEIVWRIYVTRSDGTGSFDILHGKSWVSF